MPFIRDLCKRLESLSEDERSDVTRLLQIREHVGIQEVPETFRGKCARWCGGGDDANSDAWEKVENQRVITVHNSWTFETSNFNVLRASRPVSGPINDSSGPEEVAAACEGPGLCDFCEIEKLTCIEPFGRIRGKYCCTAGNAFKSSGVHGLVIWERHRLHQLTPEEILDGFAVADNWLDSAMSWDTKQSGQASHPVLFWNCFRSGGASQVHPHMQLQLFTSPVAFAALLASQGVRYSQTHGPGRELCRDLVLAHQRLGLALELDGGVLCWSSLTPRVTGGELCALGPWSQNSAPLEKIAGAANVILRSLRRCGAEATSLIAFQIESQLGEKAWLLRCSNRGTALPQVVDAGSAELAGLVGVGSDPYQIFAAMVEEAQQQIMFGQGEAVKAQ